MRNCVFAVVYLHVQLNINNSQRQNTIYTHNLKLQQLKASYEFKMAAVHTNQAEFGQRQVLLQPQNVDRVHRADAGTDWGPEL